MEHGSSRNPVNPGERQPIIDQEGLNLTSSQAATTEYAPSIVNITHDSQHQHAIETLDNDDSAYGRTGEYASQYHRWGQWPDGNDLEYQLFNALNDTYLLPSDNDEWTRLNKQHVALLLALGELYPAAEEVRALLSFMPGEKKRVLDLGCGTGVWAIGMAHEFPDAEVVGVDLAPIPVEMGATPSNCQFEIDDINLGLPHFKESFDVVHVRLVGMGIQDFRKTMADVHRCLKPGGIVLWADADYNMYAEDVHTRIPAALDEDEVNLDQTERSWFQRLCNEIRHGLRVGGCDIYGMLEAMEQGLWENDIMDPETCRASDLYLPIGPWAQGKSQTETDRLGYVGTLMRQDFMNVHRASHTIVARLGWDSTKLDKWSELIDKQMMNMSPKMWWKMRYAWGRRRAAENEPAPPLSPLLPSEVDSTPSYPHYYIYRTQAESKAAAMLRDCRKDSAPPLPPALPQADA